MQQTSRAATGNPTERKRHPILDWSYYHGPNVQRLATIAALAVSAVSVAAVTIKYVVS